jgi:uncharacterized protein (TIGR03435 family)
MRKRLGFAVAIIVLLTAVLVAQGTESKFSFEVASIKPSPPFSMDKMLSGQVHVAAIKGSEADFQFVSMTDLLAFAYRVKPYQIAGPTWMRDGRWDIKGKIPEGTLQNRVPEMVLSLLVERFKLVSHHESRANPSYDLVVEQDGPKFKESPADESAAPKTPVETDATSTFSLGGFPGGAANMNFNNDGKGLITGGPNGATRVSPNPNGGMRLEMSRMTMGSLADMLTPFVDRPVIDATGLKGTYEVALDLPFESMISVIRSFAGTGAFQGGFPGFPGGGFAGLGGNPGVGGPPAGAPSDPTGSMFQTIQQLGLRLQPHKAPADTVVVDHLEKTPIEN